jgi:hypothetical protein
MCESLQSIHRACKGTKCRESEWLMESCRVYNMIGIQASTPAMSRVPENRGQQGYCTRYKSNVPLCDCGHKAVVPIWPGGI